MDKKFNDHNAFWRWYSDKNNEGLTFELAFDGYRFGMCFYPDKDDNGWWLMNKREILL